jgi:hypothetical protein
MVSCTSSDTLRRPLKNTVDQEDIPKDIKKAMEKISHLRYYVQLNAVMEKLDPDLPVESFDQQSLHRGGHPANIPSLLANTTRSKTSQVLYWSIGPSLGLILPDPAAFLGILHYRTTTPLQAWIPFNSIQIDATREMGPIDSEFCNKSVVMFGSEFGKLKPWNEAETHRGGTMG